MFKQPINKEGGFGLTLFAVFLSALSLVGLFGVYAAVKSGSESIPASVNANQARVGAIAGTEAIADYLTSQYCGQNDVSSCPTPADVTAAVNSVAAVNATTNVPQQTVQVYAQSPVPGGVTVPVVIAATMSPLTLNPINNPQTTIISQGSVGGALQVMKGTVSLYSNPTMPPQYAYNLYITGSATINGSFNQTGKTIKLGTNDSQSGGQLKVNGSTTNLAITYSLPTQAIPAIIPQNLQQYSTLTLTTDSSGNPEVVIPQDGLAIANSFGISQAGTYTINTDSNPGGVSLSTVESDFGLTFTPGVTGTSNPYWSIDNPTNPTYNDSTNGSVYGFVYATTDVSLIGNGYMTVVSTGSIDVNPVTDIYPFAYYSSGSSAICTPDAGVCYGNPLTPLAKLQGLALVSGSDSYTGYGITFEPGSEIINGSIGSNGEIYVHGGGGSNTTINGMIVANGGLTTGQDSLLSQGQFTTSSLNKAAQQSSFGGSVQYFSMRRMKWCSTLNCT
jgi:hypothetical protein